MARRRPLRPAGARSAPAFVSYVRVSTQQQGTSGLGLEAQQHAIDGHIRQVGGELIDEYREVESGKKNDRPELAKALRSEEHTSELQSRQNLVCRLLIEKKKLESEQHARS